MNIQTKIIHNSHHGPHGTLIIMIYIFQWLLLNRVNWTKFSAINYSSEPVVWEDFTTLRKNSYLILEDKVQDFQRNHARIIFTYQMCITLSASFYTFNIYVWYEEENVFVANKRRIKHKITKYNMCLFFFIILKVV